MNNDSSSNPYHNSPSQSYRLNSPETSGFRPPAPPQLNRLPLNPAQSEAGFPQGYSFQHRNSYDASPYFSPQTAQASSYFGSQPQQPTYPANEIQPAPQYPPPSQTFQAYPDDMARLRSRPQNVNYNENVYNPDEFSDRVMPPSRVPQPPQPLQPAPILQQQQQQEQQRPQSQNQARPSEHIDVKTKFPVARIKRIMQLDEDIGKVAQATPTAVAKALELFMIDLVSKGAGNAKDQNSKRVTATHLKNALLADPQYDFLNEICENAPDEGTKKARPKSEIKDDESDDEDIMAAGTKKKKGGKRKKADESD